MGFLQRKLKAEMPHIPGVKVGTWHDDTAWCMYIANMYVLKLHSKRSYITVLWYLWAEIFFASVHAPSLLGIGSIICGFPPSPYLRHSRNLSLRRRWIALHRGLPIRTEIQDFVVIYENCLPHGKLQYIPRRPRGCRSIKMRRGYHTGNHAKQNGQAR